MKTSCVCILWEVPGCLNPSSECARWKVKCVPNWAMSTVEANEVILFPSFPLFLNYIAKRSINSGKSLTMVRTPGTFIPGFREMSVSPH